MNKAFMMLDDLRDNYIKRKVEKESILSSSRQKNERKGLSFAWFIDPLSTLQSFSSIIILVLVEDL
jgi:hypothetical protein